MHKFSPPSSFGICSPRRASAGRKRKVPNSRSESTPPELIKLLLDDTDRSKLEKLLRDGVPEKVVLLLGRQLCSADATPRHPTAAAMKVALLHAIEEADGYFLSHVQMHAANSMMALKKNLQRHLSFYLARDTDEDRLPAAEEAELIWLDQDETPTTQGMQAGIREKRNFLLFLTRDYFKR